MAPTIEVPFGARYQQAVTQPKWQRLILLIVLGYEAAGCLLGGSLLVAAPDGHLMQMPVSLMHGVFDDFLVPGMILFLLGVLNTLAFITVLRRRPSAWLYSCLSLVGLLVWFWVEITILLELHWLHAMWGLPVLAGLATIPSLLPSRILFRNILLGCGIAASLLYLVINIIVPLQWPEYSVMDQTISELSAVQAPTRMLWLVLSAPYTLLMIAFAGGILMSAHGNRNLHLCGRLFMVYGILNILWPFAPMHLRETLAAGGSTWSDTFHIALGVVTEVLFILALVFASRAFGKSFKVYSLATLATLLLFGIMTFLAAPGIAVNAPTPMAGVWERVNVGLFLLWVILLSGILLAEKPVRQVMQTPKR